MKQYAPLLIAVMIVALLTGIWFTLFKRVEVEVDQGFQGLARQNPLLAAERMLERLDVKTHTLDAFSSESPLPPTNGALFMLSTRQNLGERRADRLLEWVDQGGFLFITAKHEEASFNDPILDPYGVVTIHLDEDEASGTEEGEATEDVARPYLDENTFYSVDFHGEALAINHYDPPEVALYQDNQGIRMLTYALGSGKVVVLPDFTFLTNENITKHDHADFLYALTTLEGWKSSELWFVTREAYPSMWEFIHNRAWMTLLSLFLFIGILIWHIGPRLGPVRPEPPMERRRLMEHVEASGRFLWKHGHNPSLLEVTQAAFHRDLRRRRRIWTQLTQRELCQHLADLSGLEYFKVQQALNTKTPQGEENFHQLIKNLETMRRSL